MPLDCTASHPVLRDAILPRASFLAVTFRLPIGYRGCGFCGIVSDCKESLAVSRSSYVQPRWSVGGSEHTFASLCVLNSVPSFQALRTCKHVPDFWSRVRVDSLRKLLDSSLARSQHQRPAARNSPQPEYPEVARFLSRSSPLLTVRLVTPMSATRLFQPPQPQRWLE
jgi:hypothetical protein